MARTTTTLSRADARARGRSGALKRHGPARNTTRIRLDDLPPSVQELVRALVTLAEDQAELARAQAADLVRREATPEDHQSGAASTSEGQGHDRPTTG